MNHYFLEGFDALEYQEHLDYDLIQSTNPEFNKAIVRVNIFRDHRQTIQVNKMKCSLEYLKGFVSMNLKYIEIYEDALLLLLLFFCYCCTGLDMIT
jgi:hypothetical protein